MKRALIFCLLPLAFSTQPLIAETHAGYPIQTTPATGGEGTVNQADTNAYSHPNSDRCADTDARYDSSGRCG